MKYKAKSRRWFVSKIGQRIFRDAYACCKKCDEVTENGLIVHDEQHADYLWQIDNEYASEGIYLNYRDKKYVNL